MTVADEEPGIELDMADLRAVAGYAVACAEPVLAIFERARPGDPRPRAAIDAARAAVAAAGAAFLHPLAQATQVKHILGAAAHAARAFELDAGGDRAVGARHLDHARALAGPAVVRVLARYPNAPAGRDRVAELTRELDAALRDSVSWVSDYRPSVSDEEAALIRRWHENAYASLRARPDETVSYLGLDIVVPRGVFGPTPTSDLLGSAVLAEVRETDRVLDMGTGSGVNAILAASVSREVLAVDLNPAAVAAAAANAARNGVADRVTCRESDVFSAVDGTFDLMVFDPPFRWFAPRDLVEASMTDENYGAMTRFVTAAGDHLAPGGRILMFFGTSGDFGHLCRLVDESGFTREVVASRELVRPEMAVRYHTLKLGRRTDRQESSPGVLQVPQ